MIRIVVVDAHPAVRTGVETLLRESPGLVPCGAAGTAKAGVVEARRAKPDVVVIDPHTLAGDGFSAVRRLRALDPAPRVLLYTADPDPQLHVLARVAGAHGLVEKAAEPAELFAAIRTVAAGAPALPPLTRAALDAAAHRVAPEDLALLAMLVDGTSAEDVAATLRLDSGRLGQRVARLLKRLRAPSGSARPPALPTA